MDIARRALYNLLRMNWQDSPKGDVEQWQIEDYRLLEMEELFSRLQALNISFDQYSFQEYSDHFESPEDFANALLEEDDPKLEDRIYLLVFELWRRYVPHKPTLSIFCDALDYQINLYDHSEEETLEGMQKVLGQLQEILEDNIDEGVENPKDLFLSVSEGCANDVESFLYDFISEQIDSGPSHYAFELVEGFCEFVQDEVWFTFLKARLLFSQDPLAASRNIYDILSNNTELDIELLFDMLNLLVQNGEPTLFYELTKRVISCLERQEDFQDLLKFVSKFLEGLDRDEENKVVGKILNNHLKLPINQPISSDHPDVQSLLSVLGLSLSHS